MLHINKNRNFLTPWLSLIILMITFSRCKTYDTASKWKNETVQMERFAKVKLAADFDEPTEIAITEEGKVLIIERKGAVKLYCPKDNLLKSQPSGRLFFWIGSSLRDE